MDPVRPRPDVLAVRPLFMGGGRCHRTTSADGGRAMPYHPNAVLWSNKKVCPAAPASAPNDSYGRYDLGQLRFI